MAGNPDHREITVSLNINRRHGAPWTYGQLRKVAAALHAGRSLNSIAHEIGCSRSGLRCALARAGFESPITTRQTSPDYAVARARRASQIERAYALRVEGVMMWREIAVEVWWPGTWGALANAVTRYARRNGLDLPAGYSRNGAEALQRIQSGSEWRPTSSGGGLIAIDRAAGGEG